MNIEFEEKIIKKLTKIANSLNMKIELLIKKIIEKELKYIESNQVETEIFPHIFICRNQIIVND